MPLTDVEVDEIDNESMNDAIQRIADCTPHDQGESRRSESLTVRVSDEPDKDPQADSNRQGSKNHGRRLVEHRKGGACIVHADKVQVRCNMHDTTSAEIPFDEPF